MSLTAYVILSYFVGFLLVVWLKVSLRLNKPESQEFVVMAAGLLPFAPLVAPIIVLLAAVALALGAVALVGTVLFLAGATLFSIPLAALLEVIDVECNAAWNKIFQVK